MSTSFPDFDELTGAPLAISLCAMDHGHWLEVQTNLKRAFEARHIAQLVTPTTLIVHDLLDSTLKTMQFRVFRQIMKIDLGLQMDDKDEQLHALFKLEMDEHGSQNVAEACQCSGQQISITFPPPLAETAHVLLQIDVPCVWTRNQCQTERLIDALGFQLEVSTSATGGRIELIQQISQQADLAAPELLTAEAQRASLARIFDELAYGLIHFSAVGGILSATPSLLTVLRLDMEESGLRVLAESIPLCFHSDIIWGQALIEQGRFENYRIRLHRPDSISILFNVSGFRDADGSIHSLWQVVSRDEGGVRLTEGSMLSEVRVHNITRNYVPQLVEKKAREAVHLGKHCLSNEERPVAVLFCDIVGFTSYVERNADSESIIDTLNSILRRVSGSVKRNNGSIDKFMGDCVMGLFDDPADAVLAAIDMQDHAADINSLRSRAGQQLLQLRIGVHWGEVIIGNVGTEERLDWTAIGDVVNTASRIEKGCQPGGILVSQAVRDIADAARPGRFIFGEVFGLQVKGKKDALSVCYVKAMPTAR